MTHPGFPGKIIGIDPGKMTGVAIFNGDGTFEAVLQYTIPEMIQFCAEYDELVSVVIVEDFITFKKRAAQQAGSRQHASQVIGMMKVFSSRHKARFFLQPADRKLDGEKLSGKKPPSNHAYSHQVDAYNHAFWWMHNAGLVRSVLEMERLGDGQGVS